MSTARAMATICCTAMEQLESCCVGLAGILSDSKILAEPLFMLFQLVSAPLVLPMYMFSATVRFAHSEIS